MIQDLYQRFLERWNRFCLCQHFQKHWYRPFESISISYIHIFVKAIPTQVKTPKQDLKSTGTYPSAFEKHRYRSGDPIPTFKPRRFELLGFAGSHIEERCLPPTAYKHELTCWVYHLYISVRSHEWYTPHVSSCLNVVGGRRLSLMWDWANPWLKTNNIF